MISFAPASYAEPESAAWCAEGAGRDVTAPCPPQVVAAAYLWNNNIRYIQKRRRSYKRDFCINSHDLKLLRLIFYSDFWVNEVARLDDVMHKRFVAWADVAHERTVYS